jgi:hypothetical protein
LITKESFKKYSALQQFTINISEKLFAKVIKNAKQQSLGSGVPKLY